MEAKHSTHGPNGLTNAVGELVVAVAALAGLLALLVAVSYPGLAVGFVGGVGLAVGLSRVVAWGVVEPRRVSGLTGRLRADA